MDVCTTNALFERTQYEPGLARIETNGPEKYIVSKRKEKKTSRMATEM